MTLLQMRIHPLTGSVARADSLSSTGIGIYTSARFTPSPARKEGAQYSWKTLKTHNLAVAI
jgi:hypothetical protein